MACTQMRMLPAEVLTALTLNAAAAVGRADRLGSLEVGKQADIVICNVPDYRQLFYHFGVIMSDVSSSADAWFTRLEPVQPPADLARRADDPRLGEVTEFWRGGPRPCSPAGLCWSAFR